MKSILELQLGFQNPCTSLVKDWVNKNAFLSLADLSSIAIPLFRILQDHRFALFSFQDSLSLSKHESNNFFNPEQIFIRPHDDNVKGAFKL